MALFPYFEMGWNVVNVEYRLEKISPAPAAVERSLARSVALPRPSWRKKGWPWPELWRWRRFASRPGRPTPGYVK